MDYFLIRFAVTLIGDTPAPIENVPTLSAGDVLTNGLNLAYFLAAIIAVIVIIVGGINYTTAAGNSANITKGKNLILYAVVGLVVIIAAYAITNFVIKRF